MLLVPPPAGARTLLLFLPKERGSIGALSRNRCESSLTPRMKPAEASVANPAQT